jgi:hypothetical protein
MPTLRLLPDLEDALRQIPGIRAASVVTGPDASPTEVHVLAAPGKAAKQVVRDVQSLALAQYDLDIDHRIVSVVQIGEDETQIGAGTGVADPDEDPSAPRPAITSLMVRTGGSEAEAVVTLAANGHVFEGRVVGPGGASQRPRLVAQATLKALEDLLGATAEVEQAALVTVGNRVVAVTVLTVMVPRTGEHIVTGSALVRGDEHDAVARSVLDALNRRITG